jgi:hypothetical protein
MKLLPRAVALLVAAFVIVGISTVPDSVRSYFLSDLRARTDAPVGIDRPPAAVLNPLPSRVPTEPPQHNAAISGADVAIAPSFTTKDNVAE